MADLHLLRAHSLGLEAARNVARDWAEQARRDFGMECTYTEGEVQDILSFKRSGVNGTLSVGPESFELSAQLGFLLRAFKEKIEAEISKNLDVLLAPSPPSSPSA